MRERMQDMTPEERQALRERMQRQNEGQGRGRQAQQSGNN